MINFGQHAKIVEAVSTLTRQEFLDAMTNVYDSGDERLVRKISELGIDIQIDEVCARVFKTKAPKADNGADQVLARKIKELGVSPPDKLALAYAIEDGSAYDIVGLVKGSNKGSKDINSCVNSSIKGASELLPWYSEWKAKPDASARGSASNEIWMITAGKNGKTPPKGDVIVDDVVIESKSSAKAEFGGEFSISGKQGSFAEHANLFKSGLSALFKSKRITVKDENEYGLSNSKQKGVFTGSGGKAVAASLQRTIDILMRDGKMRSGDVDKAIQGLIKTSFGSAKTSPISVMDGNTINIQKFFQYWTACAFDEYKAEEGFDWMIMFARGANACRSFKSGQDILDLGNNFKSMVVTYSVGTGQNNSLADISFKP